MGVHLAMGGGNRTHKFNDDKIKKKKMSEQLQNQISKSWKGAKSIPPSKQIHDRSLSWFRTDTSIK
jgi:hypothetical protein